MMRLCYRAKDIGDAIEEADFSPRCSGTDERHMLTEVIRQFLGRKIACIARKTLLSCTTLEWL